MKIEFNGESYNIDNRIDRVACKGCIMYDGEAKCPTDSEGSCILPMDKIYINANFFQVFKL